MGNIKEIINAANKLKASNLFAFFHSLYDLSLIFISIIFSLNSSWVIWGIGQILLFFHIWRSFAILHSCAHQSFFKSKKTNQVLGHIFSILAYVPFEDWKKSHLSHHKWVGDRSRDPSLCLPSVNSIDDNTKNLLDFCWRFHLPIFSFLVTLLKVSDHKKSKMSFSSFFLIFSHLILFALLGLSYFKVFLLPFLLYLTTSDLVVLSQHNLFDRTLEELNFPLKRSEHFLVTRDLKYPAFISKYILLHFDKHNLHHIVPNLSHYNISKLAPVFMHPYDAQDWKTWILKAHDEPGHKVYLT